MFSFGFCIQSYTVVWRKLVQLSQVAGLSCGILTRVGRLQEMVEQGGSTVLCYSNGVVEALQSFPILYTR